MRTWFSICILAGTMALFGTACTRGKGEDIQLTDKTPKSRIQILSEKIEENPRNPDLYYERAQAYMEERMFDKGIQDIQVSISLDSFRVDYFLLASDLYYTTKQVSTARNCIEKALNLEPENVDANTKMGELQYYLGDYPKAFEHLDRALKKDPFNARIYFTKGMIFKESGDTNLAFSSFMTAIEQDPEYFHAYMQLADISAKRHDPVAIQFYNNAINVNPMMPEAHYGLAYFLQEHGNPNGAIKVYTDLLSVDPAYVPAMHNIGYIFLFDLQKIPDAIAWFDKAIKTDSTFVLAYYHRGYAHEISGKKDLAKQDYELVLQLDPDFGLSRTRLQNLK